MKEKLNDKGYALAGLLLFMALAVSLAALTLIYNSSKLRSVKSGTDRSEAYYSAEGSLNQAVAWVKANSSSLVQPFSRDNFYQEFDVDSSFAAGSNEGELFKVPTHIKVQSSSEALVLVNGDEGASALFPKSLDPQTGQAFDPVSEFAKLNFGNNPVRVTLVNALPAQPENDFGDDPNNLPQTDFKPVFRLDAMTAVDEGAHLYTYLIGEPVTSPNGCVCDCSETGTAAAGVESSDKGNSGSSGSKSGSSGSSASSKSDSSGGSGSSDDKDSSGSSGKSDKSDKSGSSGSSGDDESSSSDKSGKSGSSSESEGSNSEATCSDCELTCSLATSGDSGHFSDSSGSKGSSGSSGSSDKDDNSGSKDSSGSSGSSDKDDNSGSKASSGSSGSSDKDDNSGSKGSSGSSGSSDKDDNSGSKGKGDDSSGSSSSSGESGNSDKKTTICHIPPGNPDNAHTITVGNSAVPAHLAHGDYEGVC
ncbi:MAG: hypothetical protein PHC51_09800, partial [bacterium]|nr:hypothetical protein [bacterium]